MRGLPLDAASILPQLGSAHQGVFEASSAGFTHGDLVLAQTIGWPLLNQYYWPLEFHRVKRQGGAPRDLHVRFLDVICKELGAVISSRPPKSPNYQVEITRLILNLFWTSSSTTTVH